MTKYFFTSDTHFGHGNILKYCNRPFKTVQEMDAEIIKRWNSKVSSNDIVFHLGDFCFGNSDEDFLKYFHSLNGSIIFIKGNHDSLPTRNKGVFKEFCSGYYDVKIGEYEIVLCHYPMLSWNKSHYGTFHLFGHHHGALPDNQKMLSFDCGVDTNNFYPYSLDEVIARMKKKDFVPIEKKKY